MKLSPMEQTKEIKEKIYVRMKDLEHTGWNFKGIQKEWEMMSGVLKDINNILVKIHREKKMTYDIMKQSKECQREKLKDFLREEKILRNSKNSYNKERSVNGSGYSK